MDESYAVDDEPALLTLELILLDLTWIRLPKVDPGQLIIPTLCFKVLDFPLVTFSPQQESTNSKDSIVVYNQGKSCVFGTSLQLLGEQFATYPIYSFLMDTGSQPAPMVAFGSFPLQAVREDIARFRGDAAGWPTVSAQRGQAYLRSTRGKRVALVNFALRLSCLKDGAAPGGPAELTAEVPLQRSIPAAEAPLQRPGPAAAVIRDGQRPAPTRWPQWEQPPAGGDPAEEEERGAVFAPVPAEPCESLQSVQQAPVTREADRCQSLPPVGSAQALRVVRLTDRSPAETSGLPGPQSRHVAWGAERQRWDHPHRPGTTAPPPQADPPHLEDVSADECPPLPRPRSSRHSRDSSAERGGSCWRAPLETDEGSLASDASSGPIVTRLIQELAAMQRATADSRHVAVQTRPLRELLQLAGPPPPPIRPARVASRRRARPPRPRRLPLIAEEPVTEGFSRRRPAGAGPLRRPPPPPPDTTAVDRLSRGQPVMGRRAVAGRLRPPPGRLRPVTLTRTAQLRLARHMADVRHDLHAQEYSRRRERWLTEQRRRAGGGRPRPLPEPLEQEEVVRPQRVSPPAGGAARRRRTRQMASVATVKSVGVQFESDGAAAVESRAKTTEMAKEAVPAEKSPSASFVEPRLSSPPSRLTESRSAAAGDRASSVRLSPVQSPPALPNATRESTNTSPGTATQPPSSGPSSAARRSQSVASRSVAEGGRRSRSTSQKARSSAAASASYTSEPFDPDSSTAKSSTSGSRRRRTPSASAGGKAAGGSGGSSGGVDSSSTLRTDRHVSEEVVSAGRRTPASAVSTVRTETPVTESGRRTGSSTSNTRSKSASQVEERISASQRSISSSGSSGQESSQSELSESSSPLTEPTHSRTQTQTSATPASAERAPAPARRGGQSPGKGAQKHSAGARPRPAPRGPPTWQRVEDPPEAAPAKPAPRAANPTSAAVPAGRSRSSSRDSAEIDARIAQFLRQSDEQQRERQQEKERELRQRQEATPGAGWLKGAGGGSPWLKGGGSSLLKDSSSGGGSPWLKDSPSTGGGGASGGGGGSWLRDAPGGAGVTGSSGGSWLKAWRVDEEAPPAAGRRPSRGRHTLSQPGAGLNTDSVSSYAPSDLEGATISDLTPP